MTIHCKSSIWDDLLLTENINPNGYVGQEEARNWCI